MPALVKTRADRAVDDDAKQPGTKRGPFLEAIDATQQSQPGLLSDLLGYGAASHVATREPYHRGVMEVDQRRESFFVAAAEPADQASLVCIRRDALRPGFAWRVGCGRRQTFTLIRDPHPLLATGSNSDSGPGVIGAWPRREVFPTLSG